MTSLPIRCGGAFGQREDAERFLQLSRELYLAVGAHGYAAIVSMDLSMLFLEEGRMNEARKLAAELFSALKLLRLETEAIASLQIYFEAAASGELDVAIVRQAKRILHLGHP